MAAIHPQHGVVVLQASVVEQNRFLLELEIIFRVTLSC